VVGSGPTHSGTARAPRRQPAARAANPHPAPPDRTSRPWDHRGDGHFGRRPLHRGAKWRCS